MPNYQQGKIYKIIPTNTDDDICYIGSTTRPRLCQRMEQHRSKYKYLKGGVKTSNVSSYTLFDRYGVENCIIELIEMFPCNSKDELHGREGMHIRSLNCVNKIIPGRTIQEWHEANPDYQKKWHQANPECNNEYQKKWYNANRDTKIQLNRKWREANSEKYTCICGLTLQKNSKSRHEKTLKHMNHCASVSVVP
ncbi:hypothetical protein EB118_26100 [bacterium]|nr:hypothetical protein [bacterium]